MSESFIGPLSKSRFHVVHLAGLRLEIEPSSFCFADDCAACLGYTRPCLFGQTAPPESLGSFLRYLAPDIIRAFDLTRRLGRPKTCVSSYLRHHCHPCWAETCFDCGAEAPRPTLVCRLPLVLRSPVRLKHSLQLAQLRRSLPRTAMYIFHPDLSSTCPNVHIPVTSRSHLSVFLAPHEVVFAPLM